MSGLLCNLVEFDLSCGGSVVMCSLICKGEWSASEIDRKCIGLMFHGQRH